MPKISKYPAKTDPSSRSFIVVDADVSDNKYKAQFGVLNLLANRLKMQKQECEFLADSSAAQLAPFTVTAIGAGSAAAISGEAEHPGIWRITRSGGTTGAVIGLGTATPVMIAGGETAEFIIRPLLLSSGIDLDLGFYDVFTAGPAVVDGAFLKFTNATNLTGRTRNNSTESITGTSYTLLINTWYRLKIAVAAGATRVDFYVYDMSGTQLWTDFLTTNIPTAAGRETGFACQATHSSSGTGLMDVDWMAYYNYSALTR